MVDVWADDDTAVYEEHVRRLRALAAVLAGPSAADDVVSATFLRAIASRGWAAVEDPGPYLTRMVVREVQLTYRANLRREARERKSAQTDRHEDVHSVPELLSALSHLSIQQRTVIFLTYWVDLTPSAIADELGITEGSVRKHLARGRESLRRRLT